MTIRTIACRQDPTKSYAIAYDHDELIKDLRVIYGVDPDKQLANILQAEADERYRIECEGHTPRKVERITLKCKVESIDFETLYEDGTLERKPHDK